MMGSHETECMAAHERHDAAVTALIASRRTHARNLWVIASALFGALVTVSLYATDKISSSAERNGEMRAEIRALQKQLDDLIIRVNKFAIIDPKALSIVDLDPVPSATCGAGCTVSQDCSDIFSQCRYCYQGRCSSVLPAQPPARKIGP